MSVVDFKKPTIELKPAVTLRPVAFPDCCINCEHHEETYSDRDDYCLENLIVLEDLFSICDKHKNI